MLVLERLIKYCAATCLYGFTRGMRSHDENNPNQLISDRFCTSLINSVIYANPPSSLFYLHKLMGRIEIKLTNKNPQEYKYYYQEFPHGAVNYNTL